MSAQGKLLENKIEKADERYDRMAEGASNIKSKVKDGVKEGKEAVEQGWEDIKDKVKKKWNKLSSDDLDSIGGDVAKVVHILQDKYGYAKDKAEEEYKEFKNSFDKTVKNVKHNKIFGSAVLLALGGALAITSLISLLYMRRSHPVKR